MASPLVSVILRTRDRPSLLREALDSLRAQSFRNFETVVVADGGEMPSDAILGPAPGEGQLTLIHRVPPHGRAQALNAGLDAARGRFIAYLDDDDLYHPDHLGTLARFLSGGETYRVAYTDVEQITQTLGADGRYLSGGTIFVYGRPFDPHRLLSSNYISLIGLMHAATEQRYDESFAILEDWDFMIRLAEHERFHHIEKITAVYRVRDDQSNATTVMPWHGVEAEAARRRLFEKHWHRHSIASQVALVDSFQNETWLLRSQVHEAKREAKEREAALETKMEQTTSRLREINKELLAQAKAELEIAVSAVRDEASLRLQLAAEREAALSSELVHAKRLLTETSDALRAFRGDASRQLQAAGEREGALHASNAAVSRELQAAWGRERELLALLRQIYASTSWRLLSPYWKLKARLSGR